jgi:hypothetical protein
MNNIPEKDWAEEGWGGFSGMSNHSDWSTVEKNDNAEPKKIANGNKIKGEEK